MIDRRMSADDRPTPGVGLAHSRERSGHAGGAGDRSPSWGVGPVRSSSGPDSVVAFGETRPALS